MFESLWRWLRNRNPILPGGKLRRGGRHISYRPRLEPLEGRELPALLGGGLIALAPVPEALGARLQTDNALPASPTPVRVTVAQNTPETVIDLGAVFATVPGIQRDDGLQIAVLGNSNAALVGTDLSGTALTLTYTRGQSGTATISVAGTDVDGVSARQTLLVTVLPAARPAVGVTSMPAPPGPAMPLDASV